MCKEIMQRKLNPTLSQRLYAKSWPGGFAHDGGELKRLRGRGVTKTERFRAMCANIKFRHMHSHRRRLRQRQTTVNESSADPEHFRWVTNLFPLLQRENVIVCHTIRDYSVSHPSMDT